jgi:hypothetical protein
MVSSCERYNLPSLRCHTERTFILQTAYNGTQPSTDTDQKRNPA